MRRRTLEFATLLLAAGADPGACLFMVQSHVGARASSPVQDFPQAAWEMFPA